MPKGLRTETTRPVSDTPRPAEESVRSHVGVQRSSNHRSLTHTPRLWCPSNRAPAVGALASRFPQFPPVCPMFGPRPLGFWSRPPQHDGDGAYRHLRVGCRYAVALPFFDFDGDAHPVDETWTFLGWSYQRHDDGLSLFVSPDDAAEWHIRLMCTPEEQGAVVDALSSHLVERP